MKEALILTVQWDESCWLGECDAIQGCLVTGYTLDELTRNLPEVLALLYEDSAARGVEFVRGKPHPLRVSWGEVTPADISWRLEFAHAPVEQMVMA